MAVTAALYCRISQDAEHRGLGVARQEKELRAMVKRRGWRVADVYVDNDVSAARKNGAVRLRPRYQALLKDITHGHVDAVVAWDLDRLFRDPLEQEQFLLHCERYGMDRLASIGDEVDIRTGDGIMVAR